MFKDHFSSDSKGYAAYRPTYPSELVTQLAALCVNTERAWDCGCGTGQLSVLLAERFDEVLATDASAAQIAKAQPHPRVVYQTATAEHSGLPDQSVDLITVAQAAHWFDLPRFYAEVKRVARPNAVIALISYGVLHVEGAVNAAIQQFYYQTIHSYWPAERQHVEDGYSQLDFPFAALELPALTMQADWDLDQLMGYLNTWSAVKEAQLALGANPVDALRAQLTKEWGAANTKRRVEWPLSLRVGRVGAIGY